MASKLGLESLHSFSPMNLSPMYFYLFSFQSRLLRRQGLGIDSLLKSVRAVRRFQGEFMTAPPRHWMSSDARCVGCLEKNWNEQEVCEV